MKMTKMMALMSVTVMILLVSSLAARADVFNMGPGLMSLETVSVGDAGNGADSTGYGAVDHNYHIGKYEVTVGQYVEFLNYKEIDKSSPQLMPINGMTANHIELVGDGSHLNPFIFRSQAGYGNNPVSYVSYWNACRFVNWVNNGQGDGDTETGAYTLTNFDGSAGGDITRNPGATWVIPTIDEWYKAAYYSGGTNGGYSDQPTASAYGTVDQYGNGWEWSESVAVGDLSAGRILGGGYGPIDASVPVDFKGTSLGDPSKSGGPSLPWSTGISIPADNLGFGFRVAEVPEPVSLLLLGLGGIFLRNRKRF